MKLAFFLHFYQPHNQQEDILNRIVAESYLPITRGLLERPHARITININAALTELLINTGHTEVIENIKALVDRGQVELSSSAKYHAFLPLIPVDEVQRQIKLNNETNTQYLGKHYVPTGFFSPEMAVSPQVLDIVTDAGYAWSSVPEVAHPTGLPSADRVYTHSDTKLKLLFRQKRVSSIILSAVCRSAKDLIKETQDLHAKDKYWFCVMDAETFGHHRIGHEKILFDILDEGDFLEPATASDILSMGLPEEEVIIRPSTWTNEEQDFWVDQEKTESTTKNSFILWKDPTNPIHEIQWKLVNFVIEQVHTFENKNLASYKEARALLDTALASDQFWWASAKPWWSLEMIEQGAYQLKRVIDKLNTDNEAIITADNYYRQILDLAFNWQRTGHIRKMHLKNSGTYMKPSLKERTPPEWYNQLVLEFEKEMNDACARQDFEKAIKWRDAIIKIGLGTDKHDVLHVLDELWSGRNVPWAEPQVKPFLSHNWSEFSDFAKHNFRSRDDTVEGLTEKDFEEWKSTKK